MNPPPDTDPHPQQIHGGGLENNGHEPPPSNWLDALLLLISSRVGLMWLESKDLAIIAARKALFVVAALLTVFFAWSLLLVAGIAVVSHATGWRWHWVALVAAALHLLAALGFARCARKPCPPAFPFTRAEFIKDRELIKNLQQIRKSGN